MSTLSVQTVQTSNISAYNTTSNSSLTTGNSGGGLVTAVYTGGVVIQSNSSTNAMVISATGDTTITGNLTVTGTTVTVNVQTLDVKDLNITVAKGVTSNALANGAGITVDNANAQIYYDYASNSWLTNISLTVGTNNAIKLPIGNTSQRPTGAGYIRYNSETQKFEGYSSAWAPFGGATGGGQDDAFYENTTTITTDYTISTNKNAMTAGPVTLNSGITVTVPSGSVWTVV